MHQCRGPFHNMHRPCTPAPKRASSRCRFGAVGTPIWFGLDGLDLSDDDLLDVSFRVQLMLLAATHVVPLIAASFLVPWRFMLRSWPFILISLWSAALPATGLSFVTTEFPALIGGIISLAVTGVLAFFNVGLCKLSDKDRTRLEEGQAKQKAKWAAAAADKDAGSGNLSRSSSSKRSVRGGSSSLRKVSLPARDASEAAADGAEALGDGAEPESVAVEMRDNEAAAASGELDAAGAGAEPPEDRTLCTTTRLARTSQQRRKQARSDHARSSHPTIAHEARLSRTSSGAADERRLRTAISHANAYDPSATEGDLSRTLHSGRLTAQSTAAAGTMSGKADKSMQRGSSGSLPPDAVRHNVCVFACSLRRLFGVAGVAGSGVQK